MQCVVSCAREVKGQESEIISVQTPSRALLDCATWALPCLTFMWLSAGCGDVYGLCYAAETL